MEPLNLEQLKVERWQLIQSYAAELKTLKEGDTQLRDFFRIAWDTKVRAAKLQLALIDRKTKFCTRQQRRQDKLNIYFARVEAAKRRKAARKAFIANLKGPPTPKVPVNPPIGDNSACAEKPLDPTIHIEPKPPSATRKVAIGASLAGKGVTP